ncbi:MAG TPA: CpsB/CapC family capsule biosynthesis tyrosine phosphatase [Chitinophagaceae bacterium]|nr:CpsB/CapC family capsule biosynthesis tyrosine phosphatase [Chitinophagaceae bacterium]
MIFFRKKKQEPLPELFRLLQVDMHSHLLPGIDDGAQDLSQSLELIRGMVELGYRKLITTPHILRPLYPNTREVIIEKLEAMQEILKEEGIPVEFQAAAEYYLDDSLLELLRAEVPLLTFGNNYVLVEFSMASVPLNLKDMLFALQLQGYQPVIAHPERYVYLEHSRQLYDELKDAGYLFQMNLLSLGGGYGRAVQDLAHHLAKKEYYDLIGTDMHHVRHLRALQTPGLVEPVARLLESGKIRNPTL